METFPGLTPDQQLNLDLAKAVFVASRVVEMPEANRLRIARATAALAWATRNLVDRDDVADEIIYDHTPLENLSMRERRDRIEVVVAHLRGKAETFTDLFDGIIGGQILVD